MTLPTGLPKEIVIDLHRYYLYFVAAGLWSLLEYVGDARWTWPRRFFDASRDYYKIVYLMVGLIWPIRVLTFLWCVKRSISDSNKSTQTKKVICSVCRDTGFVIFNDRSIPPTKCICRDRTSNTVRTGGVGADW